MGGGEAVEAVLGAAPAQPAGAADRPLGSEQLGGRRTDLLHRRVPGFSPLGAHPGHPRLPGGAFQFDVMLAGELPLTPHLR